MDTNHSGMILAIVGYDRYSHLSHHSYTKEQCMNQMHRNRIWEMVFRSFTNKTKLHVPQNTDEPKPVVDPEEIIKVFKESVRKSVSD